MKQYLDLGRDILENGNTRSDRTGTGTRSVFGRQVRFDLSKGEFPLLTTKKMFLKGIIHELLWFLKGDTNNHTLEKEGVNIWKEWAIENRREYSIEERLAILNRKILSEGNVRAFRNRNNEEVPDGIVLTEADADWTKLYEIGMSRNGQNFDEAAAIKLCNEKNIPQYELFKGDGELGPIYGYQWRNWGGKVRKIENDFPGAPLIREHHDQISELIHNLKTKPFSRRHVVSAWNVEDLPDESISPQENVKNGKMALAPCHCLFQFYVRDRNFDEITTDIIDNSEAYDEWEERCDHMRSDTPVEGWDNGELYMKKCVGYRHPDYRKVTTEIAKKYGIFVRHLDCQLYQRSADFPLGVPYNIASYALLTMMIAQCVGMLPGEFIHTFGDVHIYSNQIEKFKEQLEREPLPLPKMKINPDVKDIFSFKFEDFELVDYQFHPKIDYPISV